MGRSIGSCSLAMGLNYAVARETTGCSSQAMRSIALVNYRAFSHDVTAAILVLQNNKTAAMLVYQTSPVGIELFSYVNAFLLFQ